MKSLYDALLDAYNEIQNYNIKQDDILEKIIKDDEEAKKVIANLVLLIIIWKRLTVSAMKNVGVIV